MIVEFLWKEFLEDYDFFKIEYDNVDFDNITSIYCKLEGLYPNSAICAFNKMAKEYTIWRIIQAPHIPICFIQEGETHNGTAAGMSEES